MKFINKKEIEKKKSNVENEETTLVEQKDWYKRIMENNGLNLIGLFFWARLFLGVILLAVFWKIG